MTHEQETPVGAYQLPVAPAGIREAAVAELTRLSELVERLTPDDYKKESASAGWTVLDVVAHLNLALGLYSRLLDAVVSGHGSGTAWKAFGRITKKVAPFASPAFNAVNSAIPRVLSNTLSPETIKGQFAGSARSLRERLDRIEGNDYTRPVHYMGGTWPLSFFLAATVNEMALHGWDIASRLDPHAHLGPEARAVLPWFYWGATVFMFRPPADLTGTVQVSIADPAAAMWWIVEPGSAKHGTGDRDNPDTTITAESGVFVLALAGRISPDDAMRTTSLSAEGNVELAKRFLAAWKIV